MPKGDEMELTYEFTANNKEPIYGYGTEPEARIYLEWLNRDRLIDLYQMSESGLAEEQADTLAINLCENLADLDLIEG
jgi:hypothetical protein